jgi:hypothetical protein
MYSQIWDLKTGYYNLVLLSYSSQAQEMRLQHSTIFKTNLYIGHQFCKELHHRDFPKMTLPISDHSQLF